MDGRFCYNVNDVYEYLMSAWANSTKGIETTKRQGPFILYLPQFFYTDYP